MFRVHWSSLNVAFWHIADLPGLAAERRLTSTFRTLAAECRISGGKPTVIQGALKVAV